MTTRVKMAAMLLAAAGLHLPCEGTAQAAPGSSTPPRLAAPKALRLPAMTEHTLSNGLRVVIVEQHELPVVDLALVIGRGSEADPVGKSGLATLTASALNEGAGGRDAAALAEQIAFLAVRLNASAGFDMSGVTLHATKATLDSGVALMADMVRRPPFADKDVARIKSARLTSLLQEADRGPALADRAFAAQLYGDQHPFGRSQAGTRADVERITRADLVTFWQTWYRPNNATLIIVGDLSHDAALAVATRAFGTWERASLPALAASPAVPTPVPTAITLVDKPGAAQTSVRIGGIGIPRTSADYYAVEVMNTALGGSFTSRLNQNLREAKGYTYGASSAFIMRRDAGPFVARAEVVAAKTDSAVLEFLKELRAIRAPLPAAELTKTKTYLQLGYAEQFESTTDIISAIINLIPSGLPLRTLGEYQRGIAAVSAADVQRVAARYIRPEQLTIVLAGDRASLEPALRALKVAPVVVRSPSPSATPAPARDVSSMLVSTAWLDAHRGDSDLVILQVGTKAQYDSGHVAGARFVALSELSEPQVPGGLSLQMAPVPQLVQWAQSQGISDRSRVVIVPQDENLQSATRVFFTFAYLGKFSQASVLNGSFKAWKAEGRPVSMDAPPPATPAGFTASPNPALIATLSQVEAATQDSGRTALIDARLSRFYNGDGGGYPRPGHIPTAVNIPLNTVSANGFMKSAAELRPLFAQAGVTGKAPIITYCHIGQQATVLWFVSTLLGYEARMFDGSFQEWSGTLRLPVVAPVPPSR